MEEEKPKVLAHTSYIGTGGYNQHARDFFRHLSKLIDIKVRNFTIGHKWGGMSDEPHNDESYLNDIDKKLLKYQGLWVDENKGEMQSWDMYSNFKNKFEHNVNLILNETNHHFFYQDYKGPKIGYNVWESTLQPEHFFNKWKEFDQLWVPSQWQADCTIKQGISKDKVKVVPEGVDINVFFPENVELLDEYNDNKFKFLLFGRWDYRKSTKEIIETFLSTFSPDEDVEIVVSIDNRFSGDGIESTEERLKHFGINDKRVKIKHFPSREDYISYLKTGHVFLSCARSEGWNLPLIEAMACGTPSIYTECSGQMEFAEGKGLAVKILSEKPAADASYNHFNSTTGNYYEPDFEDLARVMRDAFENYKDHKIQALEDAKIIHRDFNWDRVAEIGKDTLVDFLKNYKEPKDENNIIVTYSNGPKVEIKGDLNREYLIEFIDKSCNCKIHTATIKNNMWTVCGRKWFTNWVIKVDGVIIDEFDLNDKRVYITQDSKSIGDTIAWAPYAVEFAKIHKCDVKLSTFHNNWFENIPAYKNIEFINPGSNVECYVNYNIGWYKNDKENNWNREEMIPTIVNLIPLQQTSTDILGLDYKELNFGVNLGDDKRPIKDKYVVFGPQATSGCKEWVFENWCELTNKFIDLGYKVFICSVGDYYVPNTTNIKGDLELTATYLKHANVFVGLGSGLSWLNWALGKHTYMINGFAKEGHEFTSNLTKITNDKCIKCWNDPVHIFDSGDWDWCPVYKGTKLQHICQKSITVEQVINNIKSI